MVRAGKKCLPVESSAILCHNPLPQTVAFSQKVQARFIKLEATTPDATVAKVNMNEIGVMVIP